MPLITSKLNKVYQKHSTKNYIKKQLFGPGQLSTLGPFLWLLLFTSIVNSIVTHISRIAFKSANSAIEVTDVSEGFVDDCFLGCTSSYAHNSSLSNEENRLKEEQDMVGGLSQLAQQWERLLLSTGGAICLNNSFWYLISWQWSKAGSAKLCTIDKSPGVLQLTSSNDKDATITVPRIEATASYRTLGSWISHQDQIRLLSSYCISNPLTTPHGLPPPTWTVKRLTGPTGSITHQKLAFQHLP